MNPKDQFSVSYLHPPRVRMEYSVRTMSGEIKAEIPFVIGVLADLTGRPRFDDGTLLDRTMLDINQDNFAQCMKAVSPQVNFSVPNLMTGKGEIRVDLTFESIDDFHPIAVVKKIPELRDWINSLEQTSDQKGGSALKRYFVKLGISPAVYTTSMRVTGSFSTSSPIPPNSVEFDAGGIVTGW